MAIMTHDYLFPDRFSRMIEGLDPCPKDLLLNKSLYLQFGVSSEGRRELNQTMLTELIFFFTASANVSHFGYHDVGTPVISKREYNPATSSGEIDTSNMKSALILAHGVLMLVAWPLLSFLAIFFAAWMKPALPNGQWFQV